MKELLPLVKTNLRIKCSIIFGEDKKKITKKILSIVFFLGILIALTEFSIIKIVNFMHLENNDILVFNAIVNLELIALITLTFFKMMNTFFLASDWKDIFIYPIKNGNLLLYKCTVLYIENIIISAIGLVVLFTYGVLTNADTFYYIHVIVYQFIISVLPIIYIALILLTVFWLVGMVKNSKVNINAGLILIDIIVVLLTYMLIKLTLNNHVTFSNLLPNIFFYENNTSLVYMLNNEIMIRFLIAISLIILSCFGFYLSLGNLYIEIMKNELFTVKDSKRIEDSESIYDFKPRNIIISNIIRDVRIIFRTPVLKSNCIIYNVVFSLIFLMVLISFKDIYLSNIERFDGVKCIFVSIWILSMTLINATSITSFSREGRSLSQFKVFPIDNRKIVISKICIGILSNIFAFINTNFLIILISNNIYEFILLEIVLIVYIIAISIIQTEIDVNSMELKWIDIKNLFQNGHYLKICKPFFILTTLDIAYGVIMGAIFSISITESLSFMFSIVIIILYSIYSLKKIKLNMKLI